MAFLVLSSNVITASTPVTLTLAPDTICALHATTIYTLYFILCAYKPYTPSLCCSELGTRNPITCYHVALSSLADPSLLPSLSPLLPVHHRIFHQPPRASCVCPCPCACDPFLQALGSPSGTDRHHRVSR